MFSIGSIVSSLLGGVAAWVTGWQKRVTARTESELRVNEALTNAKIENAATLAKAQIDWDNAAVSQMAHSWKDEWFTIILSVPAILAFCGAFGRHFVEQGFSALAHMPIWYQTAFGLAIAASFGYRKLVDLMNRKADLAE